MRTGRHSGLPWDELRARARLAHVLDPDELVDAADLYLELLDEVLVYDVEAHLPEPEAIEWLFANMIAADFWRAQRATGGVRARVDENTTRDAAEARRRAFADAEERGRLVDVALQNTERALLHLDQLRERRSSRDEGGAEVVDLGTRAAG